MCLKTCIFQISLDEIVFSNGQQLILVDEKNFNALNACMTYLEPLKHFTAFQSIKRYKQALLIAVVILQQQFHIYRLYSYRNERARRHCKLENTFHVY